MSNTWFSADLHLGHFNINKYCNRPFLTKELSEELAILEASKPSVTGIGRMHDIKRKVTWTMDETIIGNWNNVIKDDDVVYLLGDLCFADVDKAREYIKRLKGKIHFIEGNHDKPLANLKHLFVSYRKYSEITMDNVPVTLCHYALRVWNKSHRGAYSLYGHSHGSLPDDPMALSFDCGVDTNNFCPYSWEDVTKKMATKTWKPIDHHGLH